MSDDPFDDLDDDPDRQGDPFADIEDESTDSLFGPSQTASDTGGETHADEEATEWTPSDEQRRLEEDPFSELDAEHGRPDRGQRQGEARSSPGTDADSRERADPDDPFAELGQAPAEDPFADFGEAGSSVDDDVWDDLSGATSDQAVTEERGSRRYSEVSKHSFCEQCEYFSEPPGVACAHEGTEILEFLDMETVRVVDCPVVEEREQLESGHQ